MYLPISELIIINQSHILGQDILREVIHNTRTQRMTERGSRRGHDMVAYLDGWDNRLSMRHLIVFMALTLKREGSRELDIQLPSMRQNSPSSLSLSLSFL